MTPESIPTIALFLPSLEGGGAERVFVQLANEFATLDCRVDLALASACGPYLDEVSERVRVIDLGARSVSHSLPRLARYLRSERPAVILSGLDHANIVTILARSVSGNSIRCVVSTRSVPTAVYQEDKGVARWVTLQLCRMAYRFADRVIANSQAVASDLSESLGLAAEKLTVIYNPLDLDGIDRSSQADIAHPWLAPGAPPVVLGVGSLALLKDFRTLIRAFSVVRAVRECRLVILGEGTQRGELESLVKQLDLGSDVYLPGFVSNPFAWMRRASVFASSSLTEGCPNALMQALACDTPVVSTDGRGGSAEILQGGRWGRLVPVGDAEAMAEAIMATLDTPVRPQGRRRAGDFAMNVIARQYLQALLPGHVPSHSEHRT